MDIEDSVGHHTKGKSQKSDKQQTEDKKMDDAQSNKQKSQKSDKPPRSGHGPLRMRTIEEESKDGIKNEVQSKTSSVANMEFLQNYNEQGLEIQVDELSTDLFGSKS